MILVGSFRENTLNSKLVLQIYTVKRMVTDTVERMVTPLPASPVIFVWYHSCENLTACVKFSHGRSIGGNKVITTPQLNHVPL